MKITLELDDADAGLLNSCMEALVLAGAARLTVANRERMQVLQERLLTAHRQAEARESPQGLRHYADALTALLSDMERDGYTMYGLDEYQDAGHSYAFRIHRRAGAPAYYVQYREGRWQMQ